MMTIMNAAKFCSKNFFEELLGLSHNSCGFTKSRSTDFLSVSGNLRSSQSCQQDLCCAPGQNLAAFMTAFFGMLPPLLIYPDN
jgi:hypothetical protein